MEKFLKQDEEDEDDKLCIICCGNVSNILIIPCLHLNICDVCITDFKKKNPNDKTCPICRTSNQIHTYFYNSLLFSGEMLIYRFYFKLFL